MCVSEKCRDTQKKLSFHSNVPSRSRCRPRTAQYCRALLITFPIMESWRMKHGLKNAYK